MIDNTLIKANQASVTTPNKKTLVAHLNHITTCGNGGIPYTHNPNDENSYFIKLKRNDCGCEYKFKHAVDLPESSLICKHGVVIIHYSDEVRLN